MGWLESTSLLLLFIVAFFDFKDRSIPVLLLIILSIIILINKFFSQPIEYYYVLINIVILAIQLVLMMGWLKWRKREVNFFKEAFGWGDVWMLAITTIYFTPYNFVWFVFVSAFVSLIYAFIFKAIKKSEDGFLIPFAGIVSLLLISWEVYQKI